jgi:RNA polymerase sigma-70 factor (ECF subfamily)
MTDKQLVKGILSGSDQAVSFFYRKFKPGLLAFVQKKVEPELAEELVQDIFLSAIDSIESFKARSSLKSWLLGIARHEIADFYRKKKIKEIVFSKFPFLKKLMTEALSPQTALEEKELKFKILRTFSRLSEGYSQILRLKYYEGFSVGEMAEKLGISYKTAESRLFRARIAFQKEFAGQDQKNHQNRTFNFSS